MQSPVHRFTAHAAENCRVHAERITLRALFASGFVRWTDVWPKNGDKQRQQERNSHKEEPNVQSLDRPRRYLEQLSRTSHDAKVASVAPSNDCCAASRGKSGPYELPRVRPHDSHHSRSSGPKSDTADYSWGHLWKGFMLLSSSFDMKIDRTNS